MLINLKDEKLFVCDMRPGFSEDGIDISLPDGKYHLTRIEHENELTGFVLLGEKRNADSESEISLFNVDMARIGFYKSSLLHDRFKGSAEELFEWSDTECEKNLEKGYGPIGDADDPDGFFVDTGSDCECSISYLKEAGDIVGLKAVPVVRSHTKSDRSWIWVEVDATGISNLRFCDDLNYLPSFESVLDAVLSDLCTVEEENSIEFLDEDSVDIELPIADLRPEFRGVSAINVYSLNFA